MLFSFRCLCVLVGLEAGVAVSLNLSRMESTPFSNEEFSPDDDRIGEKVLDKEEDEKPDESEAPGPALVKKHTLQIIGTEMPDPGGESWGIALKGTSKILESLNYHQVGDGDCGMATESERYMVTREHDDPKKTTEHNTPLRSMAKMAACWAFTNSVIMATFLPDVFKGPTNFKKYCQRIFAVQNPLNCPEEPNKKISPEYCYYGYPVSKRSVMVQRGTFKVDSGKHELTYPKTGWAALSSFGATSYHAGMIPLCKVRFLRQRCYTDDQANRLMELLFVGHKDKKAKHIAGAIGLVREDPKHTEDYHYAPFTISGKQQMVVIDGYDDDTGKREENRLMMGAEYVLAAYYKPDGENDNIERLAISYGKTYRSFDETTNKVRAFQEQPFKQKDAKLIGVKPTNRLIACLDGKNSWNGFGAEWINIPKQAQACTYTR